MTGQATTRIGFYLLATILITVQMPRVSLAEEAANQAGAATASGGDSADHVTTGAGTPAPSSDSAGHATGAGDNGSAKTDAVSSKSQVGSPANGHEPGGLANGARNSTTNTDNSHAGQAHDAGPIDEHIAPPTRPSVNRFLARDPKIRFRIVAPGPRPRSAPKPINVGHVTRNSIGLIVPSQSGKPDRDSKSAVPVVVTPAASTVAVPTVKTELTFEHIGGQTKTVAGINGSTIVRRTR